MVAYELYIPGAVALIFLIMAVIAYTGKKSVQITPYDKIKEENITDVSAFNKIEARKWAISAAIFIVILLIMALVKKFTNSSPMVFFLFALLIGTIGVITVSADAFRKQKAYLKNHGKKKKRR